jgi:hypothetical protein
MRIRQISPWVPHPADNGVHTALLTITRCLAPHRHDIRSVAYSRADPADAAALRGVRRPNVTKRDLRNRVARMMSNVPQREPYTVEKYASSPESVGER